MAIGRQDLALGEQIAAVLGQFHGDAPRQRHVAFAVQQRLHGKMHGHQRCRARRLHVDRRPAQVEDMADAGGQKILVIAGVAQQEHAGVVDQPGVGAQVEIEIAAHPAAGINADGTFEILGRMAGVFQRLPGHLHELAVLRVEDGGLFRRKPEEIGIEIGEIVQRGGGGNVGAFRHPRRAFAGGDHLGPGQHADAFDAACQVLPERRDVGGPRHMRRHADNGDVGVGTIIQRGHRIRHAPFPITHRHTRRQRPKTPDRQKRANPTKTIANRRLAIPRPASRGHHAVPGDNAMLKPQFCQNWPLYQAD